MQLSSVDVLVIGAGPTGLGAAKRLKQLVCLSPILGLAFTEVAARMDRHG